MTARTSTPTPVKIIGTDGDGECRLCGRTGLLRVVVLSDDSVVGTECMKKVCGWAPRREHINLLAGMTVVAQHTEYGQHHALYQRPGTALTVLTLDARPVMIGGAAAEWARRGYPAP